MTPNTNYSNYAWLVRSDGDLGNYDDVYYNSYGRKYRRVRTTPEVAMRVVSFRVVTASASVTLSRIPTGAFISIYFSKFHQKYWWLRSPYTDGSSYAWKVYPVGDLVSYINDSYGRRSPNTNYGSYAWFVGPSGDVYSFSGHDVRYDSYGRSYFR